MPNVSNLVKKVDYNTKINEIEGKIDNHNHDKYVTTSEFNNSTAKVLKLANLVAKTNSDILN